MEELKPLDRQAVLDDIRRVGERAVFFAESRTLPVTDAIEVLDQGIRRLERLDSIFGATPITAEARDQLLATRAQLATLLEKGNAPS